MPAMDPVKLSPLVCSEWTDKRMIQEFGAAAEFKLADVHLRSQPLQF
jgi:hypothetical protein